MNSKTLLLLLVATLSCRAENTAANSKPADRPATTAEAAKPAQSTTTASTAAKTEPAKPAEVAAATPATEAAKATAQQVALQTVMAPVVVKGSETKLVDLKKDMANTLAAQQASLAQQLATDTKGEKAAFSNFMQTPQQALSAGLPTIGRPAGTLPLGSEKNASVEAYHSK